MSHLLGVQSIGGAKGRGNREKGFYTLSGWGFSPMGEAGDALPSNLTYAEAKRLPQAPGATVGARLCRALLSSFRTCFPMHTTGPFPGRGEGVAAWAGRTGARRTCADSSAVCDPPSVASAGLAP
ncbi:hypothetical protein GCM10018793_64700 [Streptomyces sulfonofaciens]|uniref:Uncharacterized protein n=1 Tax=Streptomyces sulfonofaciens TaxID=68272 RepID=A0A919GNG0_9ACTN|nr:hypothetical protein GCM10018793_64700 [Streptomyces sulfonofaciens]